MLLPITHQCAERTDFLESMRKLGRAAEHETRTKAEISVSRLTGM